MHHNNSPLLWVYRFPIVETFPAALCGATCNSTGCWSGWKERTRIANEFLLEWVAGKFKFCLSVVQVLFNQQLQILRIVAIWWVDSCLEQHFTMSTPKTNSRFGLLTPPSQRSLRKSPSSVRSPTSSFLAYYRFQLVTICRAFYTRMTCACHVCTLILEKCNSWERRSIRIIRGCFLLYFSFKASARCKGVAFPGSFVLRQSTPPESQEAKVDAQEWPKLTGPWGTWHQFAMICYYVCWCASWTNTKGSTQ